MDAAGVDACAPASAGLGPELGQIAEEAAAKYPNRFAILGNFPLDKPESRALIASWKSGPGMLGLRYAFTQPHQAELDDRRHDGLAVAGGGEGRHPDRADGVELPAAGRADRRAPSRAQADHRPLRPGPRRQGRRRARQSARRCWRSPNIPNVAVKATGAPGNSSQPYPYRNIHKYTAADLRCVRPAAQLLGHRHHPHAVLVEAMRDDVHRGDAVAEGPRPRTGHGPRGLRLARLEIARAQRREPEECARRA